MPLSNLGWVALLEGNLDRARALHKECLAFSSELGAHKHGVLKILEGPACAAGAGESSLAQDPIHRHVKVVERLGDGSLR